MSEDNVVQFDVPVEGDYADAYKKAMNIARRELTDIESRINLGQLLGKYDLKEEEKETIVSDFNALREEKEDRRERDNFAKDAMAMRRVQISEKVDWSAVVAEAIKMPQHPFATLPSKVKIPFQKGDISCFTWAMDTIGIHGRVNVITGQEQVLFPSNIKEGGRWLNIDDRLFSQIWMMMAVNLIWELKPGSEKSPPIFAPVDWSETKKKDMFAPWVNNNQYNPLQEYLFSLPAFDGVKRIHRSMEYGGMTINAGEGGWGEAMSEWAQSYLWVEAVRLGLYPGSQRYNELILLGPSGYGKSQYPYRCLPEHLRTELMDEGSTEVDDTDKVKIEQGPRLIGEGTEFGSGSKKDWVRAKKMVIKRSYKARVAYGRKTTERPRADVIIHTTNEAVLPDDDPAVSRRLVAVAITGRVRCNKDDAVSPFYYLDEQATSGGLGKGNALITPDGRPITNREMMWAEALHIVQNCGDKWFVQGHKEALNGLSCNYSLMPDQLSSNENGLMKHNAEIGAAYSTNKTRHEEILFDVIEWLKDGGDKHESGGCTLEDLEAVGAYYDDDGMFRGISQRGLEGLLFYAARGNSARESAALTLSNIIVSPAVKPMPDAPYERQERTPNFYAGNDHRTGFSGRDRAVVKKAIEDSRLFKKTATQRIPGCRNSRRQRWYILLD